MLYVDLFKTAERDGPFHRVNSSYPQADTVELARATLDHPHFQWAESFEVVNDNGDILAVGTRRRGG